MFSSSSSFTEVVENCSLIPSAATPNEDCPVGVESALNLGVSGVRYLLPCPPVLLAWTLLTPLKCSSILAIFDSKVAPCVCLPEILMFEPDSELPSPSLNTFAAEISLKLSPYLLLLLARDSHLSIQV